MLSTGRADAHIGLAIATRHGQLDFLQAKPLLEFSPLGVIER
jgi:hypothetical protein